MKVTLTIISRSVRLIVIDIQSCKSVKSFHMYGLAEDWSNCQWTTKQIELCCICPSICIYGTETKVVVNEVLTISPWHSGYCISGKSVKEKLSWLDFLHQFQIMCQSYRFNLQTYTFTDSTFNAYPKHSVKYLHSPTVKCKVLQTYLSRKCNGRQLKQLFPDEVYWYRYVHLFIDNMRLFQHLSYFCLTSIISRTFWLTQLHEMVS